MPNENTDTQILQYTSKHVGLIFVILYVFRSIHIFLSCSKCWCDLKLLRFLASLPHFTFPHFCSSPPRHDYLRSLNPHPALGVRADSGVLPEREASLCWEPEQRWRLHARRGAQEDHDGSWWCREHQEAKAVLASTVPQGAYVQPMSTCERVSEWVISFSFHTLKNRLTGVFLRFR